MSQHQGRHPQYQYYTPTVAQAPGKALYDAQDQQIVAQLKELTAGNVGKLRELRAELKKDDEWADVTPVRIAEPEHVVAIQYLPEHGDARGYFQAVLQSGELSERVLALTADMIRFNQADYTAWRVRWLCVQILGRQTLEAELEFTHAVMLENAKNYQLWNHRRLCALQLGPNVADREDAFSREAINFDEKNYHAWAHRQSIVKMTGRWDEELAFAAEFIQRDVRNNTAWNQRMFTLKHISRPGGDDEAWLHRELQFVAEAIQRAPRNEAPWRYLTGLFAALEPWASQSRPLSTHPEVYTICTEALMDCPSCAPAYDVLAQYYEGLAALGTARGEALLKSQETGVRENVSATVGGVLQACEVAQAALDEAAVADPMRTLYWYHRQRGLVHQMKSATELLA